MFNITKTITTDKEQLFERPEYPFREVYTGAEYDVVEIPISKILEAGNVDLYPEVVGKDYFNITLKKDKLAFCAGGFVGIIAINERIAIDIRPRVPINNLARIIEIAETYNFHLLQFLRRYDTGPVYLESLLEIFAAALIEYIKLIRNRIPYHEYLRLAKDTSFPKGRYLFGRTLKTHLPRAKTHVISESYFEFSNDNNINRCLKFAVWFLAQKFLVCRFRKKEILQGLNKAFLFFRGVKLDHSLSFLKDRVVANPSALPQLFSHYFEAVNLAKAVISSRGISFPFRGSGFSLGSLLIRMDELFENYIRNLLIAHFKKLDTNIQVLDGNKRGPEGGAKLLFDSPGPPLACPDIVFRRKENGGADYSHLLLTEVKYKKKTFPTRDEINQIIAYALSYGAPISVIVLPFSPDSNPGLSKLGDLRDMSFFQYVFDMGVDNLEKEEEKFVRTMYSLASRPIPRTA